MARRKMSGRSHGRKFARGRKKMRAVNSGAGVMRGGFRL